MSKTLFANSKAALVFAGMTILVAVAVVGPQGGGGLLELAKRSAGQSPPPAAEAAPLPPPPPAPSQSAAMLEPLDPASGWGGTADPVFGEYAETDSAADEPEAPGTFAPAPAARPPSTRSAGPSALAIGGPVKADNPGIIVPRPDGATPGPPAPPQ